MRVLYVTFFVVILDQVTKLLVKGIKIPSLGIDFTGMPYGSSKPVIGEYLKITFIENPGMAFGLNIGPKVFLTLFTIGASLLILYYIWRHRHDSLVLRLSLGLILAGAVGNLIDRTFYGKIYGYAPYFQGRVVDFFQVDFWDFTFLGKTYTTWPIFNIADIAVTAGFLLILFFHKRIFKTEEPDAVTPEGAVITQEPVNENGELKDNTKDTLLQLRIQRKMQLLIPPGQKKLRIDKYLSLHVENSSRTKIQNAIDEGNVLVNEKPVKSNYEVQPNDVIDITLPNVAERPDIVAEEIKLDIMFEDEYLLIVNKPAGMVTHPAYNNYSGTLVNGLMHYIENKDSSLSDLNGSERAGIVHRLDKGTSGILVVAKDEETHRRLSSLFMVHNIEREYWAVVWGLFKKKEGVIEKSLARNPKNRKKVVVSTEGKHAVTHYEVIKEFDFLSLIKLNLQTGRTHQIRVHMHSIGHPVFGDADYEGRKPHGVELTNKNKEKIKSLLESFQRQALHAKVLGFVHPRTGEKLRFKSELPEDMKELLKKLEK